MVLKCFKHVPTKKEFSTAGQQTTLNFHPVTFRMWVGFPGRLVMYTYTAAIQILLTSAVQAELKEKPCNYVRDLRLKIINNVRRGPTGGYIKYYI